MMAECEMNLQCFVIKVGTTPKTIPIKIEHIESRMKSNIMNNGVVPSNWGTLPVVLSGLTNNSIVPHRIIATASL